MAGRIAGAVRAPGNVPLALSIVSLAVSLATFYATTNGLSFHDASLPTGGETVASGWHDWADPADRPSLPANVADIYARSRTWTGARCLCEPGFEALYSGDRTTFVVTRAPKGYGDTLGKRFVAEPRQCVSCAD